MQKCLVASPQMTLPQPLPTGQSESRRQCLFSEHWTESVAAQTPPPRSLVKQSPQPSGQCCSGQRQAPLLQAPSGQIRPQNLQFFRVAQQTLALAVAVAVAVTGRAPALVLVAPRAVAAVAILVAALADFTARGGRVRKTIRQQRPTNGTVEEEPQRPAPRREAVGEGDSEVVKALTIHGSLRSLSGSFWPQHRAVPMDRQLGESRIGGDPGARRPRLRNRPTRPAAGGSGGGSCQAGFVSATRMRGCPSSASQRR